MSRTIKSPIDFYKGSVTIADPLTLPQAEAFEMGLETPADLPSDGMIFNTRLDKLKMPALMACVEVWELENFPEKITAENFPYSPRKHSHLLIDWIFAEIGKVYAGEAAVPNE